MRCAAFLVVVFIVLAGCKASGESDLDGPSAGTGEPPAAGDDDANDCIAGASKNEQDARVYYESNVHPVLRDDCMACHVQGGDASRTAFVLSGNIDIDYAQVKTLTEREIAGYPYLLAKATAIAGHTAGVRFELGSAEADVIRHFSDLLKGKVEEPEKCVDEDDEGNNDDDEEPELPDDDFLKGVSLLDNKQTLNKAAMIMLGRRATKEELAAVSDDSNEALRTAVRALMQGKDFTDFLMRGANDQLLTRMYADGKSLILMESDTSYYRFSVIDWPGIMPASDAVRDRRYNDSLADEPLALIAYVVTNERDYREVLLADYTVFNSFTYEFFDSKREGYVGLFDLKTGSSTSPPISMDDWVAGRFAPGVGTGYYVDDSGSRHPEALPYPHSGVLTTYPWLARWQSTDTNAQRKRAKMVMSQFLGQDVENAGSRPMDVDALRDVDNPTFKNTACAGCHYQLDSLAGTFQNWGHHGRFRLNDLRFVENRVYLRKDALSEGYKSETGRRCGQPIGLAGYCHDDLWYGDRFPIGFVRQGENHISLMPDDGAGRQGRYDDTTLRWAAEQLANDPRFATATVKFWYEAVFNAKPLNPPPEKDPAYDEKLRGYMAQWEFIEDVAIVFTRDNGYGPYNLKDMLTELFVSPWFRADAIVDVGNREIELAHVGMGVLLTPEQLERKMATTLGVAWDNSLTGKYNIMYGGIDSATVTERTREINPLMSNVVLRMVSEMACEAVYNDFIVDRPDEVPPSQDPMTVRPSEDRLLFKTYHGEKADDERTVRLVLAHLHRQLWNTQANESSQEVDKSFELFQAFWQFEYEQNDEKMRCVSNPYKEVVPLDAKSGQPAYSSPALRVWRDMLAYFMLDPLFLYE